jgi:hypothetical protein
MKFLLFLKLALGIALVAALAGGAPAQIPGSSGGLDQPPPPSPPGQPAPPATPPAVDPLAAEIMRKASAGEDENGFCAGVSWPPGDAASYTAWLEAAVVGSSKVNTFKGGADCQHDRVTAVFQQNGRKCVRYTWYACQRGKNCASGNALACKQPGGNWDTKG